MIDCDAYYRYEDSEDFQGVNVYAVIEAWGRVATEGPKSAASNIRILRLATSYETKNGFIGHFKNPSCDCSINGFTYEGGYSATMHCCKL